MARSGGARPPRFTGSTRHEIKRYGRDVLSNTFGVKTYASHQFDRIKRKEVVRIGSVLTKFDPLKTRQKTGFCQWWQDASDSTKAEPKV